MAGKRPKRPAQDPRPGPVRIPNPAGPAPAAPTATIAALHQARTANSNQRPDSPTGFRSGAYPAAGRCAAVACCPRRSRPGPGRVDVEIVPAPPRCPCLMSRSYVGYADENNELPAPAPGRWPTTTGPSGSADPAGSSEWPTSPLFRCGSTPGAETRTVRARLGCTRPCVGRSGGRPVPGRHPDHAGDH
jgi:hypothetical protein